MQSASQNPLLARRRVTTSTLIDPFGSDDGLIGDSGSNGSNGSNGSKSNSNRRASACFAPNQPARSSSSSRSSNRRMSGLVLINKEHTAAALNDPIVSLLVEKEEDSRIENYSDSKENKNRDPNILSIPNIPMSNDSSTQNMKPGRLSVGSSGDVEKGSKNHQVPLIPNTNKSHVLANMPIESPILREHRDRDSLDTSLNNSQLDETGYYTGNDTLNDSDIAGYHGFTLKRRSRQSSDLKFSPNGNLRRSSASSSNIEMGKSITPKSPVKVFAPDILNLEQEVKRNKHVIDNLTLKLQEKEKLSEQLSLSNNNLRANNARLLEELQTAYFYNSVQDQKEAELETKISTDLMEQSERASARSRKHKSMIRKLNTEKTEYESRANSMIGQMNEQMSLLQKTAMSRIEELERALLDSRRDNENLEAEVIKLKTCPVVSSPGVSAAVRPFITSPSARYVKESPLKTQSARVHSVSPTNVLNDSMVSTASGSTLPNTGGGGEGEGDNDGTIFTYADSYDDSEESYECIERTKTVESKIKRKEKNRRRSSLMLNTNHVDDYERELVLSSCSSSSSDVGVDLDVDVTVDEIDINEVVDVDEGVDDAEVSPFEFVEIEASSESSSSPMGGKSMHSNVSVVKLPTVDQLMTSKNGRGSDINSEAYSKAEVEAEAEGEETEETETEFGVGLKIRVRPEDAGSLFTKYDVQSTYTHEVTSDEIDEYILTL